MKIDTQRLKEDISLVRNVKSQSMDVACKEIGISKPTLSRLESGKTPDAKTILLICKWINKNPIDYLVD
jgi:transcriptional regulator with XRE-family HTH domain